MTKRISRPLRRISAPSPLANGGTHALVVEDSPTQAEALRTLLDEAGYRVTVATSGEQGLEHFATHPFDVVISDIVMPGAVDGYELCRRIKSKGVADTPVVLLTSLADPLDIIRGLECGADNFFTKGVDPSFLLDRLRLLLSTRRTRAASKLRVGVRICFMDREFTITSEREQILDLLISTFEDAVRQNRGLREREEELRLTKEQLAKYAGSLEQRLTSVLQSVPDVLYSVHPLLTERYYVSPACETVLGYPAAELERDPQLWWRCVHADDHPRVKRDIDRAVRTAERVTIEYRFAHRDGVTRWLRDSIVPIPDATGAVVRLDGSARDFTEQRRLEEQFRQAQKMDAVGRLAGGVAHDFNNLLTVITGYVDLLIDEFPEGDDRRDQMTEVRNAAMSAAGLTRQLLAFSRQQVMELRALDLNEVVSRATQLLKRLIGEQIALVSAPARDLAAILADPGQLEQVIVNLVVNARDAMPEGGKVTIETANVQLDEAYARQHAVVSPGPYVMLAVSDTGTGMDEETQRRIFEPFFSTKPTGKGTGLGLATVYGIVKQSGGFIWVYSEQGQGTTFKVYFPSVSDPVEGPTAPAWPAASRTGTETILLVEDAAAVREVTKRILIGLGYSVLDAPNAATAVEFASNHAGTIHLLLTDIVMPDTGGRALAGRLQELRPGLRVLFMSGYTDDAVVRHGVLAAGTAFLQKPFSPDVLAQKVRGLLDDPES